MSWLSNIVRPKIQALVSSQKDVPENLWTKCPSCDGMLFHRDLEKKLNVCHHCGQHMAMSIKDRLEMLFDDSKYDTIPVDGVQADPLKFKDKKKYADRIKDYRAKTGHDDAITVAKGSIDGVETVIAGFNFSFMGGSMGMAVGEGIVKAAEVAVENKCPMMVIPASGGARMQEGALSLMQMPRTIIAVEMVKDAGLPYLVLLTNPTTGGVSASFAMVGDIHIAEPGATIGFAGKRVIEETIREKLPEGFQTAEYLLEHGMVDMVVPRSELKETIGRILNLLVNTDRSGNAGSKTTKKVVKATSTKAKKKTTKKKASGKTTAKAKIIEKSADELPQPANTEKPVKAKKKASKK